MIKIKGWVVSDEKDEICENSFNTDLYWCIQNANDDLNLETWQMRIHIAELYVDEKEVDFLKIQDKQGK